MRDEYRQRATTRRRTSVLMRAYTVTHFCEESRHELEPRTLDKPGTGWRFANDSEAYNALHALADNALEATLHGLDAADRARAVRGLEPIDDEYRTLHTRKKRARCPGGGPAALIVELVQGETVPDHVNRVRRVLETWEARERC